MSVFDKNQKREVAADTVRREVEAGIARRDVVPGIAWEIKCNGGFAIGYSK
ncbi:hypothetical protein [Solibaculum mannosilyticum]|uniref:hypothetical protein n=1 Tax=Solibaculum mannosilyticum TaxID=2780922 RepID=UPI001495C105